MNHKITRILVAILLTGLTNLVPLRASAGVIATASDTLSTIEENAAANHTLQFDFNAADTFQAGENFTVAFPTGFDLTSLSSPNDFDLTNEGTEETLQSAVCGSTDTIRVEISSQTLTFTACGSYTAEAAGSTIVVEIGTHATSGATGTSQIANQTAAQNNSDAIIVIGGTEATGQIAVEIVADNTALITATVDPRITCTFANLTPTFASLTGPVATASNNTTVTITTNAGSGFNLSVRDQGDGNNPGLYKSAGTTYLIGSADGSYGDTATLANDVDGFGIQGSVAGGSGASVSIAARYDQTGDDVGGLERAATTLASATGAVSSKVVTVTAKAAVSGLAPAGVYTDTLTYVCTGIY